ncbi:Uncharacterised protein [Chryseobacterium gleum]|uniref:Uncharacterized protein n=2 Tax=Chryseobacterium gleum TaxID=250 RepID=A0A3S4MP92_CHRGE|nr:hypothetical protein [Chryseobacterium gleum]EFK33653.1 hypothetical protein HMPREF0204_12721 [Chryseobacterium gleum ATCC 35910]QQY34414.1 hypothetical protein I6I60_11845 [Chryseobacterium gleum]VEE06624.1 Uncharacterised protein [Chryseobacterium gleum]
MKKILTKFTNFAYNSFIQKDIYHVTWFVIENKYDDYQIICFSKEQADLFIHYTLQNLDNFPEANKECLDSSNEEAENFYNEDIITPIYQIHLTQTPEVELNKQSDIMKQIFLHDSNGYFKHTYNLSFDVIGYVTYIE